MHDLHAFLPTQLKNDFSPGSSSPFEKRDLYAFVPAQLINDFSPGSSSAFEKHDLHAFLPTQLKNDYSPGSSSALENHWKTTIILRFSNIWDAHTPPVWLCKKTPPGEKSFINCLNSNLSFQFLLFCVIITWTRIISFPKTNFIDLHIDFLQWNERFVNVTS